MALAMAVASIPAARHVTLGLQMNFFMDTSAQTTHAQLRHVLQHHGLRAALIYLNGLTAFRFTALYRFDNDTLRNLYFYDRENPHVEISNDIPVLASYCVFVRQLQQKFATADSFNDARVVDHPKRRQVRAYCGVPLMDRHGNVFGSVCHFNIEPMPTSERDVELMEALARLLHELDTVPA